MKTKIENKVIDLLAAISEFGELELPEIKFNLKGKCAGMCCRKNDNYTLKFNPKLFRENQENFLKFIVPHEVAHYVAEVLFGRVKPHGEQWQTVMKFFGIENPLRCHSFGIPDLEPWKYKCNCREHFLSPRRHASATKGCRYVCNKCKKELKFIGKRT